jgi:xanthine dehydrogenase small subunit
METRTIRFIRRGVVVALSNVPPDRTLLEVLREDLGCTGTKEGCGEGDCGACTVVVGEAEGNRISYRAVNACIRLAHSVDGLAVWTVEDIANADGTLHPAQEAMVACHGSQCGFCTPGFVMSLFGMYNNHVARGGTVTRSLAQEELSGNLCRCTGYRPILDAAQTMKHWRADPVDETQLLAQLQLVRPQGTQAGSAYMAPRSLAELLELRGSHPRAQVVAGCTDVGLWVTKMHMRFAQVLDVTRVEELRRVETTGREIVIGAAVPLADAYAALVADRPQLKAFADRFAGLPIRNSGTMGGNVANGSPIGDSMPLLIALGGSVVLAGKRGEREMPVEEFYTGYRKNVLAADEVVARIRVPRARAGEFMRAYKISKRFDDDISAVCLAVRLQPGADGHVAEISIGACGVAPTPVRATRTETLLTGKQWCQATALAAADELKSEFQPITDMRASAAYRSEVLGNLMQRFWLESQGVRAINLESFPVEDTA